MKLINRTKYTCDNLSNFLHLFELGKDEVFIMLCNNHPEFFSSEFIIKYISKAEQIEEGSYLVIDGSDLAFREMTQQYFEVNPYTPQMIMEFFLSTNIKPFNKGWWHLDKTGSGTVCSSIGQTSNMVLNYNIFMFREVEKYVYNPTPTSGSIIKKGSKTCTYEEQYGEKPFESPFKKGIRIKLGFLNGNILKAKDELRRLEMELDAIKVCIDQGGY